MNKDFRGTATFLVKGDDIKNEWRSDFVLFLKDEGFKPWSSHGFYSNCDWMFINVNSKVYAPGMPGVQITEVVFNHAITIDEFKTIYNIYQEYNDLQPLIMKRKKE